MRQTLKVVRTLPTGFEPTGIVCDRSGVTLYIANRLSSDISVIDLNSGQEIKRLLAGRGASYLALSADGKWIYGTHIYPNAGAFRTQPNSEITVIDTARQAVVERKRLTQRCWRVSCGCCLPMESWAWRRNSAPRI